MRKAFHRAAKAYDQSAVLQQEVGRRLLERLDLLKIKPQRILDLGTGTGDGITPLLKKYPKANIIALDIAEGMLQVARKKTGWWQRLQGKVQYVAGEAEHLPLADNSIDLVVSNLTLQWCDLPSVFTELQRVMAPGASVLFTTFGPQSLKELRTAWAQVDTAVHIHEFTDMHDVGDAMVQSRLAEPVMDMEMITVTYDDAWQIMRDLKNIGAHNVAVERPRYLTGKQRIQKVIEYYETYRRDAKLPVTYEIVYGHAWVPEEKRVFTNPSQSFPIPVKAI